MYNLYGRRRCSLGLLVDIQLVALRVSAFGKYCYAYLLNAIRFLNYNALNIEVRVVLGLSGIFCSVLMVYVYYLAVYAYLRRSDSLRAHVNCTRLVSVLSRIVVVYNYIPIVCLAYLFCFKSGSCGISAVVFCIINRRRVVIIEVYNLNILERRVCRTPLNRKLILAVVLVLVQTILIRRTALVAVVIEVDIIRIQCSSAYRNLLKFIVSNHSSGGDFRLCSQLVSGFIAKLYLVSCSSARLIVRYKTLYIYRSCCFIISKLNIYSVYAIKTYKLINRIIRIRVVYLNLVAVKIASVISSLSLLIFSSLVAAVLILNGYSLGSYRAYFLNLNINLNLSSRELIRHNKNYLAYRSPVQNRGVVCLA